MAARDSGGSPAPVSAPAPEACTPGLDAAREAWSPLEYGEGARVGVLGDSGVGKSTAERELIAEWLRRSPGVAIVIDDKGPRQRFQGQARRDVADLRRNPIDKDGPRVIVLRGDCFAGYKVDREEVAEFAWKLIGRRQPVLLVFDELKEACAGGQWKGGSKWLARSFSQGREVGLSVLWGTQDTQEVPSEAFNQSGRLLTFKIAGNGLRLLGARNYLVTAPGAEGGELEALLPALPGEDDPPDARGIFVLLRRGRPWNGLCYRFAVRGDG
jgi:hypothetical protein